MAAIFGADRETFNGSEMSRVCARSWMLVSFLQHGEDGWATERFPPLSALSFIHANH